MRTFSTSIPKGSKVFTQSNFKTVEHILYSGYKNETEARICKMRIDVGMWKPKTRKPL